MYRSKDVNKCEKERIMCAVGCEMGRYCYNVPLKLSLYSFFCLQQQHFQSCDWKRFLAWYRTSEWAALSPVYFIPSFYFSSTGLRVGEWREVSGARSEERWQKGNGARDWVDAIITNVLMWTKKSNKAAMKTSDFMRDFSLTDCNGTPHLLMLAREEWCEVSLEVSLVIISYMASFVQQERWRH